MAKKNAVIEAAEVHADRCIAAAQALEAEAKRLKDHAKSIRENTRSGRLYTQWDIDNFAMHKAGNIEYASRQAIKLAEGKEV